MFCTADYYALPITVIPICLLSVCLSSILLYYGSLTHSLLSVRPSVRPSCLLQYSVFFAVTIPDPPPPSPPPYKIPSQTPRPNSIQNPATDFEGYVGQQSAARAHTHTHTHTDTLSPGVIRAEVCLLVSLKCWCIFLSTISRLWLLTAAVTTILALCLCLCVCCSCCTL